MGPPLSSQRFVLCGRGDLPGCRESQVPSSCLCSSQTTALAGDSDPNSPLCTAPHMPAMGGGMPHNPFALQLSYFPAQLDSVRTNCGFNLVSLLAGQLYTRAGSLTSHTSPPLLKVSMLHPHHSAASLTSSSCTPPPPKAKSLSQSRLATACQYL